MSIMHTPKKYAANELHSKMKKDKLMESGGHLSASNEQQVGSPLYRKLVGRNRKEYFVIDKSKCRGYGQKYKC